MNIYDDLNIEELKYYYDFKDNNEAIEKLNIEDYIKYLIEKVEKSIVEAEASIELSQKVINEVDKE